MTPEDHMVLVSKHLEKFRQSVEKVSAATDRFSRSHKQEDEASALEAVAYAKVCQQELDVAEKEAEHYLLVSGMSLTTLAEG